MIVVNYGMGTNSTGLLCEATARGIIVDLIVASDTGFFCPSMTKPEIDVSIRSCSRGPSRSRTRRDRTFVRSAGLGVG